ASLAALLPACIAAFNALMIQLEAPVLDWRDYLAVTMHAPFTEGLSVTLMLVTTLLPTLLHAFAALLLLVLSLPLAFPGYRRALGDYALVNDVPVNGVDRTLPPLTFLLALLIGLFAVCAICAASWAALATWGLSFADILADIALWAGGSIENLLGAPV
ncbi:MAG: hypothetical protein ACKVH0_22315, partial [Alphaproteobacteria bacterium]